MITFRTQSNHLIYAVRGRVVLKYFGQLALVCAGLMLVPVAASLLYGEHRLAIPFLAVVGVLGACGLLARLQATDRIQANEALVVIASIFLAVPLVTSYPFTVAGLPWHRAWFEAVSALTTTGLSTIREVGAYPHSLLFCRAWMQWYGGLGIVVLSFSLVMHHGNVARKLATDKLSDQEDLIGGTRAHARYVAIVYLALTGLGLIAVVAAGSDFHSAVLLTTAAVSTGGFAPHDDSLASLSWPVQGVLLAFCLAGAVSLVAYPLPFQRWGRQRPERLQLKVLLVLVVLVAAASILALRHQDRLEWTAALWHGTMIAVSAQSTAGFSTVDVAEFDPATKALLLLPMFVGGGAGSTAGGIKLIRLLVALRCIYAALVQTALPKHAVQTMRLEKERLEPEDVIGTLQLILLYVTVVILSWIPFLFAGYEPLSALFDVVSAVGTVGLSSGVTSPDLPVPLCVVLCADMTLGRLELVALLVMFFPYTWFGQRLRSSTG